jgi:hypothetical protein
LKGFTRSEFGTLIIDLTKDLDDIWSKFDKYYRKHINRAEREGVIIKLNQNYEEFYDINRSFRQLKGLPKFFISIDYMKKYGTLFIIEFDGEILGGCLCLEDKNNIRGLIAASKRLEVDREKSKLIGRANRLIHWYIIKYAKEKGIKEYDMGGFHNKKTGNIQKDNIDFFKQGFGGEFTIQYIYEKDYTWLYKSYKKINNLLESLKK